jgi:hypothetical protein
MNKPRKRLLRRLRNSFLFIIAVGSVVVLLGYRQASLAPRLFPAETSMLAASQAFLHAPINILHLPLKALQLAVTRPSVGHTVLLARLPSVLFGLFSFVMFMYITRRWYGRRSMVVGCLLFATSAWFLHAGRFAGVQIEYLAGILALLAIHVGLYDHDDSPLMMYVWLVANLLLLTIPGFVWFVLLSLLWQGRVLLTAWKKLHPMYNRIIWTAVGVLGLAVIAYVIVLPRLYWQWLGMPAHISGWQALAGHVGQVFISFVYQGPSDGQIWIAHWPILDAFITAAFVMGALFYSVHWRAARTRLIASYLVLGGILTGLRGGVDISIMVPLIYLVAIGGVTYALYIWMRRFPRNQLARGAGILGVVLLVGVSCVYNLREYFIAWPKDPDTTQVLSLR